MSQAILDAAQHGAEPMFKTLLVATGVFVAALMYYSFRD